MLLIIIWNRIILYVHKIMLIKLLLNKFQANLVNNVYYFSLLKGTVAKFA